MVFEAVLVKKLCSDVTVMKIFQYRIKNISMARENSFTRCYYKVLMGGGGGELTCTPKSTGVQLGQRGTGCSTRTLASAGSNCSDTTKNPKMTRKEEAQFLPPPPIHTHTCEGGEGQYTKDRYLKNASYQR